MIRFLSIVVLIFSTTSYARDTESLFKKLKNSGKNYRTEGTICEEVAKLKFQEYYPADQYSVETEIAYWIRHMLVGEFDLVVTRKKDGEVILLGEVKCWGNFKKALFHARQQRNRFQKARQKYPRNYFKYVSRSTSKEIDPNHFSGNPDFVLIAQEGGVEEGFDYSIGFTREEMMELRARLVECQDNGDCARP